MKNFLALTILVSAAIMNFGCSDPAPAENKPANQNTTASTAPQATPETAANSANSAPAVAEKTPFPAFTDAAEALAEGNRLLDLSKFDDAVEAFKQAAKLNPDLAEAHFQLGVAYDLLESEKEAEEIENPGAVKTPTPGKGKQPEKLSNADKAYGDAIKAYKKLLSKNPKDDRGYFNLARAYLKLNDDKEAEKAIRQAVKLKPEDSEYQAELGGVLIQFAKYPEAIGVLKKALKLDENNSRAESLMEKAEAGRKREDFAKPKVAKPAAKAKE